MPELPEVEVIRRTLVKALVGACITRVHVRRRDIILGPGRSSDLLHGHRVQALLRRGKQLALVSDGPVVVVHLGMTGSLRVYAPGDRTPRPHEHIIWTLSRGDELVFHDPRRFGQLRTMTDRGALHRAWQTLGPDALTVTPKQLADLLATTSRAIKAALLDQHRIAGLGNIYVDELLHDVGLHPLTPAHRLTTPQVHRLTQRMHTLLRSAIRTGGSTLRDYRDGKGQKGTFQQHHRAYGRSGSPCTTCGNILSKLPVSGRTTTFCPSCQPLPSPFPPTHPPCPLLPPALPPGVIHGQPVAKSRC